MSFVLDLSDVDGVRRNIAELRQGLEVINAELNSGSELSTRRGKKLLGELLEVVREYDSVTHYDLDI